MYALQVRNPSRKSHNALDKYPTIHYFVTEMCTHVHISVTKWCIVGYGTDAFWHLCDKSISPVYEMNTGDHETNMDKF